MNECQSCDGGDVQLRAGNNSPPIRWQFLSSENPDVLFPIDGKDFFLSVKWRDGSIYRDTGNDPAELVVDVAQSIVTWNYTIEESREIPMGRIARYELEARETGMQATWIDGHVIVEEGINTDV